LTAGVLLLAYSLGLGIPFLLAAIGLDQLRGLLKRIQRQMHTLELISGVFLIGMGVLLMTGQLAVLAQVSSGSSTLTNLEGCVTGVLTGQVPSGDFGTCMDLGVDYKSQQALAANGLADAQSAVLPTPTAIPAELAGTVGVGVGQTAPDFTVQTLDGKSVSLNSLRGRVVLLNFWATWCLPCRSEMPAFQKIAASYKSTDFTILAVNFRETQDQVQQYAHDLALTLPLGIDPQGTIGTMYHAVNFPVSYIIGRDGVILRRQLGPFTLSTLAAEIDHIVTPGG
jgi:peroxiredoxin